MEINQKIAIRHDKVARIFSRKKKKDKSMQDLAIEIFGVKFNNPIWTASGTFGNGKEFQDFVDLRQVGAILPKTITVHERKGNPLPRIVESSSGLINSIGLENKGVEWFVKEVFPFLKATGTRIVVSVAGKNKEEFSECVTFLLAHCVPDAIEINLSCPNVAHANTKYSLFAQDPEASAEIVSAIKKIARVPLIAKLTPMVSDIREIAKSVETAGAQAVALVNTYPAMAIDAETFKPLIGNISGGLSGPAIKPMALKAVWDVYKSVKIPVIGIGGIMTGIDVAEFMIAGARAVQIGTVNFVDPGAYGRILKEFGDYLDRKKIKKSEELIGRLDVGSLAK
ncbi:dihydroorotate dehydrogenase family protein [Candidatus Omnitrophus magneticus]|uniref:Dihydroorotate dehydrogenase n=1 Tax=Candidatus Omnitrophus magneticus TaxID=1609969 RepID=A0A0F0CSK5_9BACT|nr:dihydroorotate dehydrogenase family protein [Candidatus Omnitrophus magneticus]